MIKYRFELTGESPVLFHADDVEAADTLREWRQDPANQNNSVAGDDRSPPWTWMTYLYSDGTHLVIPSDNVMRCLRDGAAQVKISGTKTFKALSQSGLLILDEHCEFTYRDERDGKPRRLVLASLDGLRNRPFRDHKAFAPDAGFRLDVRRAAIKNRGKTTKHVRVRAQFKAWTLTGTIAILSRDISIDHLKTFFDIAGERVGLLDWRPGSPTAPGQYGRFTGKLTKAN